jgi:hypothetical protein
MIAEPYLYKWICPIDSKDLRGWKVYEDTNGDGYYDTVTEKDCSGYISRRPIEGNIGPSLDIGYAPEVLNPSNPVFVNNLQKWAVVQKDSVTNDEIYRVEHDYQADTTYIVITNEPTPFGTGVSITYLQAEHPKILEDITISPNPTKEYINISFSDKASYNVDIVIGNLEGKVFYQNATLVDKVSQKIKVDVSQLPMGVYFIKFESEGLMSTKQLIITR